MHRKAYDIQGLDTLVFDIFLYGLFHVLFRSFFCLLVSALPLWQSLTSIWDSTLSIIPRGPIFRSAIEHPAQKLGTCTTSL